MGTFNDNAIAAGHPEKSARRIHFEHKPHLKDMGFENVAHVAGGFSALQQLDEQAVHQVHGVVELRRVVGVDVGRALAPAEPGVGLDPEDQHLPHRLLGIVIDDDARGGSP